MITGKEEDAAGQIGIRNILFEFTDDPQALGVPFFDTFEQTPENIQGPYIRRLYGRFCCMYGLPEDQIQSFVQWFGESEIVEMCVPDAICSTEAVPNDPMFNVQWAHGPVQIAGSATTEAWNQITASTKVVAVVDTGVDFTHEDLAQNMWVNPNPRFGDIHGMSSHGSVSGNCIDHHGHGTHVAGISTGVGNNSKGIAGVCWSGKIMSCRFLDHRGYGDLSDAIVCWNYAVSRGASIVNNSWGIPIGQPVNYRQLLAIFQKIVNDIMEEYENVIFVFASGNDGANADIFICVPSNVKHDRAISVGATNHVGGLAVYSNYGNNNVAVFAPGGSRIRWGDDTEIWSSVPPYLDFAGSDGAKYWSVAGTSMAAPFVSGALALMMELHPSVPLSKWREILIGCCYGHPGLFLRARSSGRLNMRHLAIAAPNWQKTPEIEADFDPEDPYGIIIKITNKSAYTETITLCARTDCLPRFPGDEIDTQTYSPGETKEIPFEVVPSDWEPQGPGDEPPQLNWCFTATVNNQGNPGSPHAIGYWLSSIVCPPGNDAVEVRCDTEFDEPLLVDFQSLSLLSAGHFALLIRCLKSRAKLVAQRVNISGLYRFHKYDDDEGAVDITTPKTEDMESFTDIRDGAQALWTVYDRIMSLIGSQYPMYSWRFQTTTFWVFLDLTYWMSTQKYRRLRPSEQFKSYTYRDFMYPEKWQKILAECLLMLRKMRAIFTANAPWYTTLKWWRVYFIMPTKENRDYNVDGLGYSLVPWPTADNWVRRGSYPPTEGNPEVCRITGYHTPIYSYRNNPLIYPYMEDDWFDIDHNPGELEYCESARLLPPLIKSGLIHAHKQRLTYGVYYRGDNLSWNPERKISAYVVDKEHYFAAGPDYAEAEVPVVPTWEYKSQHVTIATYTNFRQEEEGHERTYYPLYEGNWEDHTPFYSDIRRDIGQTQFYLSTHGAIRPGNIHLISVVLPVTIYLDLSWYGVYSYAANPPPGPPIIHSPCPEKGFGVVRFTIYAKHPGESAFRAIYSRAVELSGFAKTVKMTPGFVRIKIDEVDLYHPDVHADYKVVWDEAELPMWSRIKVFMEDGPFYAGAWQYVYLCDDTRTPWVMTPQHEGFPVEMGNKGYYTLAREGRLNVRLTLIPDFEVPQETPSVRRVPNLIGRIWDPVEGKLKPPPPSHINVHVEAHKHPEYDGIAYVFAQTPPPSSILCRDDEEIHVTVFVMAQPDMENGEIVIPDRANVPNVMGMNLMDALDVINDAGFEASLVRVQSNLCEPMCIHHQLPEPGDFWQPTEPKTIMLTLCFNNTDGVWQSQSEVFPVENVVLMPHIPEGTFRTSTIPTGLIHFLSTPRNIVYSGEHIQNPVVADVPCLLGMTLAQAQQALAQRNLEMVYCGQKMSTYPDGLICQQLPRWGKRVMINNRILVAISMGRPEPDDLFRSARFPVEE